MFKRNFKSFWYQVFFMPREPQRILKIYGPKKWETEGAYGMMTTSQKFTSECFVAILGETGKSTIIKENIPEKLKCEKCDLNISTKKCSKYYWGPQADESFPEYDEFRSPSEWASRKR